MEQFLEKTIKEAGKAIFDMFGKIDVHYTKDTPYDVVTKADLVSQEIIVRAIKKEHPSHGIVGEEENLSHQSDAEYIWYIDPLDGTRNFATHVPLFGIHIGMAYKNEMQYGAIYLPVTDEFCFAEKGKGALLNGKKIKCSEKKEWEYSYGIGPTSTTSHSMAIREKISFLSNRTAWLNSIASAAVSTVWVASGKRDWYLSFNSKIWDYAAPSVILKESGCMVTNFRGENWSLADKEFIVSNQYLHQKLIEILKEKN